MGGGAHPQSPPTPGRTTGCCPTAPPGAGGRGSPPGLGPHMPSQACKPPRFESGSEPLCSVPRASCLTVPPGLPFTTFLYDVCLGQSHQVLGHAPTLWPQRRSHFDDHRRMGGGGTWRIWVNQGQGNRLWPTIAVQFLYHPHQPRVAQEPPRGGDPPPKKSGRRIISQNVLELCAGTQPLASSMVPHTPPLGMGGSGLTPRRGGGAAELTTVLTPE